MKKFLIILLFILFIPFTVVKSAPFWYDPYHIDTYSLSSPEQLTPYVVRERVQFSGRELYQYTDDVVEIYNNSVFIMIYNNEGIHYKVGANYYSIGAGELIHFNYDTRNVMFYRKLFESWSLIGSLSFESILVNNTTLYFIREVDTYTSYGSGYTAGYVQGDIDGYGRGNFNGYLSGYADGILVAQLNEYDAGYSFGWTQGSNNQAPLSFADGYLVGFADGQVADFDSLAWLSSIFFFVGTLFTVKLANVPIGAIVLMPIILALIPFMLGLFKGGNR